MPASVGDDEIAADADQGAVERVALARFAADVKGPEASRTRVVAGVPDVAAVAHRRSMARTPVCHGRGSGGQERTASAGRAAATWSIARRSNSRPDGSKS